MTRWPSSAGGAVPGRQRRHGPGRQGLQHSDTADPHNKSMQGRIGVCDAVEKPGLQFRILRRQQLRKLPLLGRLSRSIMIVQIAFEQIIQFEHPPAALPA